MRCGGNQRCVPAVLTLLHPDRSTYLHAHGNGVRSCITALLLVRAREEKIPNWNLFDSHSSVVLTGREWALPPPPQPLLPPLPLLSSFCILKAITIRWSSFKFLALQKSANSSHYFIARLSQMPMQTYLPRTNSHLLT